MPKHIDPVRVLGQTQQLEVQRVDDHRGRFGGVPSDQRRREREERYEEKLQHIEEQRRSIDARQMAQVDGAPDPVGPEHRETERKAEEARSDRDETGDELGG